MFLWMPSLLVSGGYTLKSAVFGLSSSLVPHVGGGDGLVCESIVKAILLSDHFDGKQSGESVDLPLTCHPSSSLTRSSVVKRLLLDMDPYGAPTHWVCFLFFLRELLIFWILVLVECFGLLFVWVISRLDRNMQMSPLFRIVHRPPHLPLTNWFP